MNANDIKADRKDGTPERIWAWPFHPGYQNEHMTGGWFIAQYREDAEYIRADIHAAQIAALEAQVAELKAENAALAAWQCIHTDGKTGIVCDEYGNQYCAKDKP